MAVSPAAVVTDVELPEVEMSVDEMPVVEMPLIRPLQNLSRLRVPH